METEVITKSIGNSRQTDVTINGKTLVTPTYFPAISSVDIKYSFKSLIKHFVNYPRVLISAYDCYFLREDVLEKMCEEIEKSKIPFVFLDSGVFESSRKKDKKWNIELHNQIRSKIKFDFHSSFDILYNSRTRKNFLNKTIEGILHSRNQCDNSGFVPIVHGGPRILPQIIKKLAEKHPSLCDFIAVAERDCGDTIFQRARTISNIRKILDNGEKSNCSRILHILGCGDPISMLLFTYAGANSFDSLDWIKSTFDLDRSRLVNFSHLELLNCDCLCCSQEVHYIEKVLMHNLWLYQNYIGQINTNIEENTLSQLLDKHFSKKSLNKIIHA